MVERDRLLIAEEPWLDLWAQLRAVHANGRRHAVLAALLIREPERLRATLIGMFGRVTKNPAEITLGQWQTLLGALGASASVAHELLGLLAE